MMGQALSDDLRIRVLKASASGMSARQAAARFGVDFDRDPLDRESATGRVKASATRLATTIGR